MLQAVIRDSFMEKCNRFNLQPLHIGNLKLNPLPFSNSFEIPNPHKTPVASANS